MNSRRARTVLVLLAEALEDLWIPAQGQLQPYPAAGADAGSSLTYGAAAGWNRFGRGIAAAAAALCALRWVPAA